MRQRYALLPTWKLRIIQARQDQSDNGVERRARKRRKDAPRIITELPSMQEIFDAESLIRVYRDCKRNKGLSPGPDRVTYNMLSHREVCAIMRALSMEIMEGRYWPSRALIKRIAKKSGGTRKLSLRSIVHRVVAARLNEEWSGRDARVHFVGDYYAAHGFREWLLEQGHTAEDIGSHAGIMDTSQLLYVNAKHIRTEELAPFGGFEGAATQIAEVNTQPPYVRPILKAGVLEWVVRGQEHDPGLWRAPADGSGAPHKVIDSLNLAAPAANDAFTVVGSPDGAALKLEVVAR